MRDVGETITVSIQVLGWMVAVTAALLALHGLGVELEVARFEVIPHQSLLLPRLGIAWAVVSAVAGVHLLSRRPWARTWLMASAAMYVVLYLIVLPLSGIAPWTELVGTLDGGSWFGVLSIGNIGGVICAGVLLAKRAAAEQFPGSTIGEYSWPVALIAVYFILITARHLTGG
jgi:hypothetical protein